MKTVAFVFTDKDGEKLIVPLDSITGLWLKKVGGDKPTNQYEVYTKAFEEPIIVDEKQAKKVLSLFYKISVNAKSI